MDRREREQLARQREKAEAEAARRAEREYQRAIQAGGDVAAEAKWQRLYAEMIDAGSNFGLCQWALDDGNPGACTRRARGVYCHVHNRQLDRESERRRREKERASTSFPTPTIRRSEHVW